MRNYEDVLCSINRELARSLSLNIARGKSSEVFIHIYKYKYEYQSITHVAWIVRRSR